MQPILENQGPTYDCGCFAPRMWFEGYGYSVAGQPAYQRWIATADSQQGLSFQQVHQAVTDLAAGVGAAVTWLGDGYLRDFGTFDQAVRDGWCVIVGVWLGDLHLGVNYYHFEDVDGLAGDTFAVTDSFYRYDGETGSEPVSRIHQAAQDNWSPDIIGLAFRLGA